MEVLPAPFVLRSKRTVGSKGFPLAIGEPLSARPIRQSDLPPPDVQFAGGVSIRVDDTGGSTDALQPDRLPHKQLLVVGYGCICHTRGAASRACNRRPGRIGTGGVYNDQVTRRGRVDRTLNRPRGGDVSWSLAADCDGHRVDRFQAVGGGNDQFTAKSDVITIARRPAVLLLLLYGAWWHVGDVAVPAGDNNNDL